MRTDKTCRRPGQAGLILMLACVLGACDSSVTGMERAAERSSPPLSVDPAELRAALVCQTDLAAAGRSPVLMVPGTTVNPTANFAWNWLPALDALGWPWCTIELPGNSMGDVQVAAEYVVYAVRTMAAESGRTVQILGHSQGGMLPRWALRFWPDIRPLVDDLVGFSASNHGTVLAPLACVPGCAPALWQQDANSNFMAALNADFETVPEVDYTSIYTQLDEIVVPNFTALGASSALQADGPNVINIATQSVCPLNLADHFLVGTSDPVAYALAIDALSHEGPADPVRLAPGLCLQAFMPGVNPLTFVTDLAGAAAVVGTTVLTAGRVSEEPPLKCYVENNCVE